MAEALRQGGEAPAAAQVELREVRYSVKGEVEALKLHEVVEVCERAQAVLLEPQLSQHRETDY